MKALLKLPLILAATAALLIGVSSLASADNIGTDSSNLTGLLESNLPLADNDLTTAVNDVLSADMEALDVTLADLNNTQDPATVENVPICGISLGSVPPGSIFTTGHFVLTPSGNAVLVCHGQIPVGPPMAVHVNNVPCFSPTPPGLVTSDSHTVITPSGQVILVCHFRS
jgi:hypothetical protein